MRRRECEREGGGGQNCFKGACRASKCRLTEHIISSKAFFVKYTTLFIFLAASTYAAAPCSQKRMRGVPPHNPADISGVDMWFALHATYYPIAYSSNLTIWLAPSLNFDEPGSGSVKCYDNFSPPTTSAKHTISCSQTLNNTRWVMVWKPLFTASLSLWVYEMRVIRSGALAVALVCGAAG